MQPLVSIIIPLYNAEKYIAGTIQSAIEQTWPNKEIIIIDDGSEDNSLAIARNHQNDYIRIFSQQNKGASIARNYGLQEAKGTYIQFLDADDLLSKDKISSQIDQLTGYPDHIGLCGTIHFQDGVDPLNYPLVHEWFSEGSDDPADFLIKLYGGDLIGPEYGGMVQPNAWLTPRHLINKSGMWNETKSPDDDGEFFCRVILESKGIKYSFEGINFYRKFQNTKSWSSNKSYEACSSILQSTRLKLKYLTAHTNNPQAKTALSRVLWENAVSFYPQYPDLYKEAASLAKSLDKNVNPKPFNDNFKKMLSRVVGWKSVKQLTYIKSKF